MADTTSKTTYKPRWLSWTLLLIIVGIVIFLASLLLVKGWMGNKPKRPDRPPVTHLPFVETLPVNLSDNVVEVSAGGFVSAKHSADITPQVSGKIVDVSPNLSVGSHVKKGEVLVQLETSDYQIALSSAKAKLASAKASLSTAKANLINANSTYQQVKAQARQAARDVKNLGLKATDLNLKKPQVAAAKSTVDNAKAAIASAKAAIDSAKAQIVLAETNLQRTTITAPFAAVVLKSEVAIGEMASAGTLIARLSGIDVYTVKLTFDRQKMRLIAVGDTVQLFDKVYNKHYQGELSRLAAGLDENRTLAAYVDIPSPLESDKPLLLNTYIEATVAGQVVGTSMHIPNSAIVDNRYVWGKNPDDTIRKIPVEVVYRRARTALVTLGAAVDDIITRPKEGFVEGQTVTTENSAGKDSAAVPDKKVPADRPKQAPDKAIKKSAKPPEQPVKTAPSS